MLSTSGRVSQNYHVFNKNCPADVRVSTTDLHGVRSYLGNFPTTLKLKDDKENEVPYRLIGTVAYTANHFTGYSFRNMTKWERSDDLEQKTTPASAKTEDSPHLILYVRTPEI